MHAASEQSRSSLPTHDSTPQVDPTDQLLLPVVGIPVSQVLSVCLAVGAAAAILVVRKKQGKKALTQDIVEEKNE